MGLFDTIQHKIKVNVGKVEISEWQTKDLANGLNTYKSGSSAFTNYKRLNVIATCFVEGELLIGKHNKIIGFKRTKVVG